eukprot:TRINITY_DN17087_c0_g1_i2.p2 TRINITY_DN17087_c0_g1~~TRINITY_DN17087_c0_g1_i2.p2  ORF type:complete len:258 (-),score=39.85 TRINITY_DN17087_c0_g1_i2:516-1289(-)
MKVMTQIIMLFVLILIPDIVAGESVDDAECIDRHKNCLFVVAITATGGHALVDILNQHPKVKIQGSNNGLIVGIRKSITRVLKDSYWGSTYENAVKGGKYRVAWYNPERKIDFQRALVALFNVWYATDVDEDDIIGFIEPRFGLVKSEYDHFKAEVNTLKNFCLEPKIILQLSYNLEEVENRWYWQQRPQEDSQRILQRLFYHFQSYHHEYPNDTMIVTQDDVKINSTKFYDIFKFIGLEYVPQNFLLGRFGEKSYL